MKKLVLLVMILALGAGIHVPFALSQDETCDVDTALTFLEEARIALEAGEIDAARVAIDQAQNNLAGCGVESPTTTDLAPATWSGPADFGTLEFVIHGTDIEKITYGFSEWHCGPVTMSGSIGITGGTWPISEGAFSITNTLAPDGNLKMTLSGTFDSATHATGTWDAVSYGEDCAGTWEASAQEKEEEATSNSTSSDSEPTEAPIPLTPPEPSILIAGCQETVANGQLSGETYLCMISEKGDWVGSGETWLATADATELPITVTEKLVSAKIDNWTLEFAAENINLGTYDNAARYPFNTDPGLNVSGHGHGCNTIDGRFEIYELYQDPADEAWHIAINFEQHCDGNEAALWGVLRINSTVEP